MAGQSLGDLHSQKMKAPDIDVKLQPRTTYNNYESHIESKPSYLSHFPAVPDRAFAL
jgi:hypothetical protein